MRKDAIFCIESKSLFVLHTPKLPKRQIDSETARGVCYITVMWQYSMRYRKKSNYVHIAWNCKGMLFIWVTPNNIMHVTYNTYIAKHLDPTYEIKLHPDNSHREIIMILIDIHWSSLAN